MCQYKYKFRYKYKYKYFKSFLSNSLTTPSGEFKLHLWERPYQAQPGCFPQWGRGASGATTISFPNLHCKNFLNFKTYFFDYFDHFYYFLHQILPPLVDVIPEARLNLVRNPFWLIVNLYIVSKIMLVHVHLCRWYTICGKTMWAKLTLWSRQ